jgi:tRNA U34 5-carboxymethylaminomethyl modifying enzyme MnmG/GidA
MRSVIKCQRAGIDRSKLMVYSFKLNNTKLSFSKNYKKRSHTKRITIKLDYYNFLDIRRTTAEQQKNWEKKLLEIYKHFEKVSVLTTIIERVVSFGEAIYVHKFSNSPTINASDLSIFNNFLHTVRQQCLNDDKK